MSYGLMDFRESLKCAARDDKAIEPTEIASVEMAWGADEDGWRGGFLMRLKDGRFAYLHGWCDYTGWG